MKSNDSEPEKATGADNAGLPPEERTYEHITVVEYNEHIEGHDTHEVGDRAIFNGVDREIHHRDEEKKGFVKVGEAVAIIELNKPMKGCEITEWCNTEVGKLALAHFFDGVEAVEQVRA